MGVPALAKVNEVPSLLATADGSTAKLEAFLASRNDAWQAWDGQIGDDPTRSIQSESQYLPPPDVVMETTINAFVTKGDVLWRLTCAAEVSIRGQKRPVPWGGGFRPGQLTGPWGKFNRPLFKGLTTNRNV